MGLIDRLLGNTSEQQIKKIKPLLNKINALEDGVKALSDEQLRGKTAEFRERLAKGESLEMAARDAKDYINGAIVSGADYTIGHGFGPVNHFYALWK